MRNADLIIKNGNVVTPQGIAQTDISVRDEKIISIGPADDLQAESVYDAKGKLVLPGAIDPHVHFMWEGGQAGMSRNVELESAHAAKGGVTTASSTPIEDMNLGLVEMLEQSVNSATDRSYIDFKFSVAPLTRGHLKEIPSCIARGANMYKFYMGYKGDEAVSFGYPYEGLTMDFAYEGFSAVAEGGPECRPMIHAEEPYVSAAFRDKVMADDRKDLLDAWNDASPGIAEAMDIFKCALLAKEIGTSVYAVHVSAKESVDTIRYLHSQDYNVIGETCVQYLVLESDKHGHLGAFGKVKPPIRRQPDVDRLWRGIREGTIKLVGTDTCPYTREQKLSVDFWDAPVGLGSGMAFTVPLMYSEGVRKARITVETMARVLSENVARAFGIYPKKGVLQPGSDADIVVLDPEKKMVVDGDRFRCASEFCAYDGMELQGLPEATFVRGHMVAKDYEIVTDRKIGKWLPVAASKKAASGGPAST